MTQTFFFYDLETSGINSRSERIMQFAGQRTTLDLQLIGEPHNHLIKLANDILPSPEAVLLTGITPQMTHADGYSEAQFIQLFMSEIAQPGTIFVGYNNVRFDDEFMRNLLYRNYCDPYGWQWQDERSKWDLLDVVRLTRALRPEGIKWPKASNGKSTNRLELLTKLNGLGHESAHDALSDVLATIEVAGLIKKIQPKLFTYMLGMRNKHQVKKLVESEPVFVYVSGSYSGNNEHLALVTALGLASRKDATLVYDLSFPPSDYIGRSETEIIKGWAHPEGSKFTKGPIKELAFNRCPAVAPLATLDSESIDRLGLNYEVIQQNYQELKNNPGLAEMLTRAYLEYSQAQKDKYRQLQIEQTSLAAESALYESFFGDDDQSLMAEVRTANPAKIVDMADGFDDWRLRELALPYLAHNYPESLTSDQSSKWEEYRKHKLLGGGQRSLAAKYFAKIEELANQKTTSDQEYLLEELRLYGQSILPSEII